MLKYNYNSTAAVRPKQYAILYVGSERRIRMKRFALIFLLVFTSLCLFACGEPEDTGTALIVDGVRESFKTEPVLLDEQMMIFIEDAETAFGIPFNYDEESGLITAANEDYSVELTVDSLEAKGTRKKYTLTVAPRILEEKVMLPLEFVAEQLGYTSAFDAEANSVMVDKEKLVRDEPQHEYEKWAIARARQLTDFTFTPLYDIPTHLAKGERSFFKAGKEYKGFPYSSTEQNDKFICENVTFETFLSALANPDSVLYTKDMYQASNASTYYGIVCNSLVRYCFGIKARCNTQNWLDIPGMKQVAAKGTFSAEDIQLCDVLHAYGEGANHVAIITGILRDEAGNVAKIEVSEATLPTCRRRIYTASELLSGYAKYKLCRYEYLDSIPAFDEEENAILKSGIEKQSPKISVDYGNKSNYLYGEMTVISSFAEGDNTVEIIRDGVCIEEIQVNGYTKIKRSLDPGYYEIRLAGTEHFVEFCVCQPIITHTVEGRTVTVIASSSDPESKIINMDFRSSGFKVAGLVQMVQLTEEEKASGVIVRQIPNSAKTFKISFENKYGIWTHTIIYI